jgi:hypothetical protein
MASALMFHLAFAPPAILRNAWRQTEPAMLRSAMGELKSVTGPAGVADCLLRHVVGMVGGRGASMLDESGATLGSYGQTPADVEPSVRFSLSSGWPLVWGSPTRRSWWRAPTSAPRRSSGRWPPGHVST